MTSHHSKKSLNLISDDIILDMIMNQADEDNNVENELIPQLHFPDTKITPIQTLETLCSEAEALGYDQETLKQIKKDEIYAVYLFSNDFSQLKHSEELLSNIINKHPNYPSAFNNRAQIKQILALQLKNDEQNNSKRVKMLHLEALSDLNQCIQLCYRLYPLFAPENSKDLLQLQESIENGTSNEKNLIVPRCLLQSLSQRGLLHKLRGKDDLSYRDLKQAAALGQKFAQNELDNMNEFEKLNKDTVHKLMKQYFTQMHENTEANKEQLKN